MKPGEDTRSGSGWIQGARAPEVGVGDGFEIQGGFQGWICSANLSEIEGLKISHLLDLRWVTSV